VSLVIVLLLAAATGLFLTTEREAARRSATTTAQPSPVDLAPLRTAHALARLPGAPEEQPLAREALRLADRDADLTFAVALRDAVAHPIPLDGEILDNLMRLQDAEKRLQNDQKRIAQLTAEAAKASGKSKQELEQDLQVARAEMDLDQNEVEDAKEDLIRAGGDPQARIQRMVDEHKAATQGADAVAASSVVPAALPGRGLTGRFREWNRLRDKQAGLRSAQRDATTLAASLGRQHDSLQKQVDEERAKSPEMAQRSAARSTTVEQQRALLSAAKRLANSQKQMAELNKRMHGQEQLAGVYGRWGDLVAGDQRAALHRSLLDVLWILLVVLIVFLFNAWLEHYWAGLAPDRRRLQSLRTVVRAMVQALGVCVILLLLFGPPAQLATVVGLAGAGLTVALKDFIVGFFGWFVLMGKHGIRVGDWVEIKGVGGEVAEIGLFHTVLLETGNWTDTGHPTGRRVTFLNSFAIEGHYFNFSTAGQWLWDELRVNVTADDPGQIVDAIQKRVAEETAEDTQLAEQEWRRVPRTRGMSAFAAQPTVNVRPATGGVEVLVRYITRANLRHQSRDKLYSAVVELLRKKNLPPPPSVPG